MNNILKKKYKYEPVRRNFKAKEISLRDVQLKAVMVIPTELVLIFLNVNKHTIKEHFLLIKAFIKSRRHGLCFLMCALLAFVSHVLLDYMIYESWP